ncbi:MAG: hypothetical protein Fur0037_24210 [Planctomycetota bacterium]
MSRPIAPLLCLALAAAAPSQDPARGTRESRVSPAGARSAFCCVDRTDRGALATGRNWRARIEDGLVEFLPALGRDAPRVMPLRFRLSAVRRGGRALPAEPVAVSSVSGRTVEIPRESLRESYAARPEGLEQRFEFQEPPGGAGDLSIEYSVETDLEKGAAIGGGIRWRAPGICEVFATRPVAIDARGGRADCRIENTERGFEIVVPARALDEGSYPLLVDPLFGAAVESFANADCDFPDAAYDPVTDSWCVVWTMYFGGGQSGAVGSAFTRSNLSYAYAFQINQQGNQDKVRVAHIGGSGVFLIVWCNRANGQVEVSGLGLDPGRAMATSVIPIAGPGAVDDPAISGEATAQGTSCIVVWDDAAAGVVGSTVSIDANLQVGLGPFVTIGGGPSAAEPAISKQGGAPGIHVVSWADRPAGLPGWVRAQVVDYNLNLLGPGVWIRSGTQNAGRPAVDGDGFLFLFAWEEQESANPSATDVMGRTITASRAGITSLGPVLGLAVYPSFVDGSPDVAMLGRKFGVAYQSGLANTPWVDDVYFRAFSRSGTPIGDELPVDLTATGSYVYEHAPRLASVRDGDAGSTADDGLLVFADQDNQGGDSNVGLQAVASMGPGGTISDIGGGCGPAGLNALSGPFALGNDEFRVELYGADALAIPFLSIGLPGPPQSCGVCTLLNPMSFRFAPNTAGTSQQDLPLPGAASLLGLTVEFQWVVFGVPYVGCPLAPGMAASNRIRATFGY